MTNKTTSIHNINADKGINLISRGLYVLLNALNNSFPNMYVDKKLTIRDFTCSLQPHWDKLEVRSTPHRKLSNLFWITLPWLKIKEELNEINIFDTGCGSGRYGPLLMNWGQETVASYTGLDAGKVDNWANIEAEYPNIRFHQSDSGDISQYIPPGTNFFMSQSAIEHFDEDLLYFERIKDYIQTYNKPVIQIHHFPSSACLWLYRGHGVRQYTPRTASKISKLYHNENSYAILYKLGGSASNQLLHEFYTKPVRIKRGDDLRDLKPEEYHQKSFDALEADLKSPQKSPAFYVLVIHSNMKQRVF